MAAEANLAAPTPKPSAVLGKAVPVLFLLGIGLLWTNKDIIIESISFNAKADSDGFLHRIQQESWNWTDVHEEASEPQPVMMKSLRTGSDSLRTCLFGDQRAKKNVPRTNFGVQPPVSNFSEWTALPYVFSHAGRDEAIKYNKSYRRVSLFTVMRQPVERVLSYFVFSRQGSINLGMQDNAPMTFEDFFTSSRPAIAGFVQNGLVWQFGHVMHPQFRKTNVSISVALERAMCFITRMDVVAFFDDMADDFDLVHARIFPHVSGNLFTRLLFKAGELLRSMQWPPDKWRRSLLPRQTDPRRAQELLRNVTVFDQRLYDFAWWWWKDPRGPVAGVTGLRRLQHPPCEGGVAELADLSRIPLPLSPRGPRIFGPLGAPPGGSSLDAGRAAAAHSARARILQLEASALFWLFIVSLLRCCGFGSVIEGIFARVCNCTPSLHLSLLDASCFLACLVMQGLLQEYLVVYSSVGRSYGDSLSGLAVLVLVSQLLAVVLTLPALLSGTTTSGGVQALGPLLLSHREPALLHLGASLCQLAAIDRIGFVAVACAKTVQALPYSVSRAMLEECRGCKRSLGMKVMECTIVATALVLHADILLSRRSPCGGLRPEVHWDTGAPALGILLLALGQVASCKMQEDTLHGDLKGTAPKSELSVLTINLMGMALSMPAVFLSLEGTLAWTMMVSRTETCFHVLLYAAASYGVQLHFFRLAARTERVLIPILVSTAAAQNWVLSHVVYKYCLDRRALVIMFALLFVLMHHAVMKKPEALRICGGAGTFRFVTMCVLLEILFVLSAFPSFS